MPEQQNNSPLPPAGEGAGERAGGQTETLSRRDAPPSPAGGRGEWERWLVLAALVVILDQWAKYAILGHFSRDETLPVTSFFNLTLAYNQGAAFGMLNEAGGWQRWFFAAIGVGASIWITFMLRRHAGKKLFSFALALIMGGALGNVVDRFAHDGHVVDFLDFHWGMHHFAVFNLADAAITCGAALLLLESFIDNRRVRHARPASPGDESGK